MPVMLFRPLHRTCFEMVHGTPQIVQLYVNETYLKSFEKGPARRLSG